MDENREKEIQLLCSSVLKSCLDYFDNPNGGYEYRCPFCSAFMSIGGRDKSPTMKTIGHDQDCAYLIAKSLSTNNT